MLTILSAMASLVSFRFRRRASLELEVLALRHQVAVLHRQRPGRAWLRRGDRLLWAWLYRAWRRCLKVMVLVKPATVLQWHRQGFRRSWRWRSSSRRVGRPGVNREIRDLIRQMSVANPLWGAPRIHGEMLKLGIEVSQATVGRHMVRRHAPPSPTWRAFLSNQVDGIACRAYAQAHDQYFTILREADNCLREILVDRGPEADARRARALPRLAQGIAPMPDQGFCGPDKPFDEADRRRLFGDD